MAENLTGTWNHDDLNNLILQAGGYYTSEYVAQKVDDGLTVVEVVDSDTPEKVWGNPFLLSNALSL